MSHEPRIFISHSSKDEALVDKSVDLLQTGCNISTAHALCTTLKGLGIEIGTDNYIRFLREELCKSTLVVLLLSPNYLASSFCLCELGGTWALNLPIFPLVVPPLKKADVKATLAVTQCGLINREEVLDELRDRIKELIGTEASTQRWNSKRDQFLDALPGVLQALPPPETVPFAKLQTVEEAYNVAREELCEKNEEIETLKEEIQELKACKDAKEVKAVAKKYSSLNEEFEKACKETADAVGAVKHATQSALYRQSCSESYFPNGNDEWEEAREAADRKEITISMGESCLPNSGHPRVRRAEEALMELKHVVDEAQADDQFSSDFEDEYGFPLDFTSKEFWQEFIANV